MAAAKHGAAVWRVKKTRTTGRIFYMNEVTGEKKWSVDASLIHRDHVDVVWKAKVRRKDGKTYYLNVLTGKKQWSKPSGFKAAGAARVEPVRIWKRRTNPRNGRTYYKNTVTGKGTYTKPDDSLIITAARACVPATAPAVAGRSSRPVPGRARRAGQRESTTTRNPLAGRKRQSGATGASVQLPLAPSGKARAQQLGGAVTAAVSAGLWRARLHAKSGRIFYKNSETKEKQWTPPKGATVVNRAETRMRHEILKLRKKLEITTAASEETAHERDRLEERMRAANRGSGGRGGRGGRSASIGAAEAVAAKKAAKKVALMTVELEALETELEDSRANNEELASALAVAERALEAANVAATAAATAGSAPEELEALRADADDMETRIEELQDDLADAQEIAARATVATAEAKTALAAGQSAIAAATTTAGEQLGDLEEELAEKNAVCETLSDELTSAHARAFASVLPLCPSLFSFRSLLTAAPTARNLCCVGATSLERSVSELDGTAAQLRVRIAELEDELESLAADVARLRAAPAPAPAAESPAVGGGAGADAAAAATARIAELETKLLELETMSVEDDATIDELTETLKEEQDQAESNEAEMAAQKLALEDEMQRVSCRLLRPFVYSLVMRSRDPFSRFVLVPSSAGRAHSPTAAVLRLYSLLPPLRTFSILSFLWLVCPFFSLLPISIHFYSFF